MNSKFDHYDEYYHCDCEGQAKLDKLNHEIFVLERQLSEKKEERKNHLYSSIYYSQKNKLELQLQKIEEKFEDDSYNPAIIDVK